MELLQAYKQYYKQGIDYLRKGLTPENESIIPYAAVFEEAQRAYVNNLQVVPPLRILDSSQRNIATATIADYGYSVYIHRPAGGELSGRLVSNEEIELFLNTTSLSGEKIPGFHAKDFIYHYANHLFAIGVMPSRVTIPINYKFPGRRFIDPRVNILARANYSPQPLLRHLEAAQQLPLADVADAFNMGLTSISYGRDGQIVYEMKNLLNCAACPLIKEETKKSYPCRLRHSNMEGNLQNIVETNAPYRRISTQSVIKEVDGQTVENTVLEIKKSRLRRLAEGFLRRFNLPTSPDYRAICTYTQGDDVKILGQYPRY